MTAVLLDDIEVVATIQPAVRPALAPVPATRAGSAGADRHRGDPMVDAAARLLSIPLRHMYAALWRVGLIEVR